jgi:hypothetical protein
MGTDAQKTWKTEERGSSQGKRPSVTGGKGKSHQKPNLCRSFLRRAPCAPTRRRGIPETTALEYPKSILAAQERFREFRGSHGTRTRRCGRLIPLR